MTGGRKDQTWDVGREVCSGGSAASGVCGLRDGHGQGHRMGMDGWMGPLI